MHRLTKDQTKLVEELIGKVTNALPGSELFRQCVHSSTSSLRHHQYLSVSPPDVEKNYAKLIEKLDIHSQCKRSNYLRQVIDEFLNCGLEDPTECSKKGFSNVDDSIKSECHYQLLAFLWHLQHSPQSLQMDFKPLMKRAENVVDTTDWHKLLLEDLDDLVRDDYVGQSSSSDDFDTDEDDREASHSHGTQNFRTNSSLASTYLTVAKSQGDFTLESGGLRDQHVIRPNGEGEIDKWLRSRIHPEYWNSTEFDISSISGSKSSHRAMQFKRDWDAFVSDRRINGSRESTGSRILLKEKQLIREVLWMLSGASDSFVFQLEMNPAMIAKNCYTLKRNVTVADVSNDSLDTLLQSVAQYGSMCAGMRSMSNYVYDKLDAANTPEEKLPRTICAFVSQMQVMIMKFQKFVYSLEEEVRQWATHTLLEVFARLRPWFRRLSELYTVVIHVTAGRFESLHWESTVVLVIDALFDLLCSHWTTRVDDEQLRYLSDVFVNTVEPYLASMDTLLAGTQVSSLTSGRSELFMAKCSDVSRKDAIIYWKDAFTLKYFAGRGMILSSVPKILHPFVHRLIVTVKSMDFLIVISEEKAMPELVKEIAAAPGAFVAGFGVSTAWLRSSAKEETSLVPVTNISSNLHLGDFELNEFTDNPLLRRAILGALPEPIPAKQPEDKSSSEFNFSSSPLRLLLHESLQSLILERHRNVSKHLLTVLLDRLHLRRAFKHLFDVFLLRRGDLLEELTHYLFTRMRWPGAPWREQLPLNILLHQCLMGAATYCSNPINTDGILTQEEAHRFWLAVEAVPSASLSDQVGLSAFNSLTLRYQPAWPLEVVLTPGSIKLYAEVFRFLLRLRRVKNGLEGLQFQALERRRRDGADDDEDGVEDQRRPLDSTSQLMVSRLHVMRIKVLHILNSLHQFLMHRIIHSAVIDFQREMDEVEDLVDLCTLHQQFVHRVFRCCLLGDKAEVFRKSFMELMQLGLIIERIWLQGLDVVTDRLLNDIEKQFTDHTTFLYGVFRSAVNNVNFKYLEPLAMAFKDRGERA